MDDIKKKMENYGNAKQRSNMQENCTLAIHRKNKESKTEEKQYDNTLDATLLLRTRINCLHFNYRKKSAEKSDTPIERDGSGIALTLYE